MGRYKKKPPIRQQVRHVSEVRSSVELPNVKPKSVIVTFREKKKQLNIFKMYLKI